MLPGYAVARGSPETGVLTGAAIAATLPANGAATQAAAAATISRPKRADIRDTPPSRRGQALHQRCAPPAPLVKPYGDLRPLVRFSPRPNGLWPRHSGGAVDIVRGLRSVLAPASADQACADG